MADTALIPPRASPLRVWVGLSTAVRIAIVYAVARAVTTGLFAAASALSTSSSRFGVHPGVGRLLVGWDAQWYWLIAVSGYPTTLPTAPGTGAVVQNQWAFMPVYPYLVRPLGGAGVGWTVAAVVVSVVAGYLACLVLHAMLRPRVGRATAMWAVVLLADAPLAAIFQIGYAEALFLLLLFCGLWCVQRRRYVWLWPLIPAMGLTRPGVLAFALLLGLHGVRRLVARDDRLRVRDGVHVGGLAAWAALVGFAWPVVAGLVTGRPDAYIATELSWRAGWVPTDHGGFVPFGAFVQGAVLWFHIWGLPQALGVVALIVVVCAFAAALVFAPAVRRLGSTVRLWSASYAVYLLAVFFPQSSLFRLLVPLSPMWGAAVPRRRRWRLVVLAGCIAGQWLWIFLMYARGNTFWQIP